MISKDISELKTTEEKLLNRSHTVELTGLFSPAGLSCPGRKADEDIESSEKKRFRFFPRPIIKRT